MAYFWIGQRADGASVSTERMAEAGLAPRFDDQALAEQWLTAFYPELVELGVEAAAKVRPHQLLAGAGGQDHPDELAHAVFQRRIVEPACFVGEGEQGPANEGAHHGVHFIYP